ncbi:protein of unknown function DUF1239 [Parvibaculum lavamentivorans DS-1]|uniref:LPS export ABC transporter periplasmic protein LptC n=1 Tax=Parvibaculum lavamentivorans (strain DS-1 / DSM 13023 / NCIMB 13966) TaxID=402881 RepID=A7HPI5_PARL1|nr:LPS export ABC transporter periplasmic protein LptC [Parvibaculum lavamentivorans]ABS61818.1 protein of unknown function DUF1239 [Parvibaculum lavamentivorans DS-1]
MSEGSGDDPSGGDPATGRRRPAPRSAAPVPPRPVQDRPVNSRYSSFVSLMKVGLPVGAIVLLGVVLVYSGVFDSDDRLEVTFREIDTQPSDLRMVSPRLDGVTSDGKPYVITADNATQDPASPNFVTLDNIQADIKFNEEEDWLSLTATSGRYDSEAQTLNLSRQIDIFTTWGYEVHGEEATVDFDQGMLTSEKEVTGQGPLGTLRADRMRAHNATQVLRFDGNVKMLILPDQPSEGDE